MLNDKDSVAMLREMISAELQRVIDAASNPESSECFSSKKVFKFIDLLEQVIKDKYSGQ